MSGVVTIHFVDVGVQGTLARVGRRPKLADVPGLRNFETGFAVRMRRSRLYGRKGAMKRAALIGFWDDDDAVEEFEQNHPVAQRFSGGLRARLIPFRRHGIWPGLDEDIPTVSDASDHGTTMVITLGQLRSSQALRFTRVSLAAEIEALDNPALVWATAILRPPFVATCSLWESTDAVVAFGRGTAHGGVVAEDAARPFHRRDAYVRFRPYRIEGHLDRPNGLSAEKVQQLI
jgi:hypothetical protein